MGWEDAPIVQPAAKRQAWEDAPIVFSPNAAAGGPRVASGIGDAFAAGWQGSATGLASRGRLPDVQLDPHNSKWYERLIASGTQLAVEAPISVLGALGGGAAGSAVAPGLGTLVGGGAGAFAIPTAIRESLVQAYQSGDASSSGDFLSRASIVLKHTAKDALIGGLTAGLGKAATVGAATVGAGSKAAMAAGVGAELGTLVVAPAALEGRLPEPQEFLDAAVLLVGLKGATTGAKKLADIYAKTGKTPTEVLADAQRDPTIVADLTPKAPDALEVAQRNNTFTGQTTDAGRGQGMTQPKGTPIDQLFSNFGDAVLPKSWRDTTGQGRTREQAQAEQETKFRARMFDRANGEPKQFANDPVYTSTSDLGNGLSIKLDAAKSGRTRVQILRDGEVVGAARIEKGKIDSIAVKEEARGANLGETMLRWLDENRVANIDEVPDRSPGFVAIQKKVIGSRKSVEETATAEPAKSAAEVEQAPAKSAAEDQLPRAYRELARQENNRNAVPDPSPEAARFLDKPFAEVPQLPGEPILSTHVNYNYLNTTADVKGAMSRLSELYEGKILEQTRGKVSWEQTYAEARKLFEDTTGEKAPALPLGTADYAKLSADLYARKQLLTSGAEQLMAAREAYVKAREAGTATDQMKLDLLAQIDRVAQAQAEVRGTTAEVGRALNVLKSTNRDKAYYDQLNDVINSRFNTDGTPTKAKFDAMVDLLGTLETPGEVLRAAERLGKATTMDKIIEAWRAGLLTGPVTHVANSMGNSVFLATRPVIDVVAAGFGMFSSSPDRVRAVEPLARVVGNVMGVVDGAKAAGTVLKTGVPFGSPPDAHRNAISGLKGEIIRAPYRLLSAADAFFRISNERGEAYALASREAASEGFNPATREFRERVAEIVSNPTDKMREAIESAGARYTFQAPLGEFGKSVQDALAAAPVMKFFVPFVQTPTNVAKEMLRLTPAAPFVKEWRDAVKAGGAERQKALAEMAAGTAVGATVVTYALSGNISGQGDPDPKKRAAKMASGWQPYSIKVGDTWYSYQRLQPVGTLMGMAADAAQVWDSMTPEEQDKIPKILSVAFANAITNQTFLQGITNVINAISDPQRFGPRFVQNFTASFVPAAVGQTAQMMDPYQREVYSVLDAVKARVPGVREDLFPKRDVFGEPIQAKDRMGEITPIVRSTESQDKVRQEMARLGIGVAKAPDHIELPAGKDPKLGKVMLTPEQRDIFSDKAGHMAYQILSKVVEMPGWDAIPDLAQRATVEKVFESARKYGKAAAIPPEQIMQETLRISQELQKRLQPK